MNDEEYYNFVRPYADAMQMLLTRLDVLNHNLYGKSDSRPIHYIQNRIKKKKSLEEKLIRRGKEPTVDNAKDYLQDIAGVRIICYFVDDIYNLAKSLKRQADLIVIREQDYIKAPKPNGYRSYHLIVGVPVYCMDGMEYFPVEVQLRTLSMDFWASMEHRISYKKERADKEELTTELLGYANQLQEIEKSFESHNEIGKLKETGEDGKRCGKAEEYGQSNHFITKRRTDMEKRKFEKLGIETSLLGFGCMRFPATPDGKIDEPRAEKLLDRAIAAGVNYIDTAYPYHNGDSEPFVGKVLQKYDRNSFYLATKLPVWAIESVDDAKRVFAEQLERLRTDHIDFYLMHAMSKERWDKVKELGIVEFCEQLKAEGKIRYLGFSFHDTYEAFEEVLRGRDWDFCQIQYNYMDTEEQAGDKGYALAEELGIPLVIMEPVKGGSLANFSDDINAKFKAMDKDASIASWAFRWVGSHSNVKVILSGMSNEEQVEDNLKTFSNFKPLNEAEEKMISEIVSDLQGRVQNGCTGCRYCMPCPAGVNIPQNFALWNKYHIYGTYDHVKNAWEKDLKDEEKAKCCVKCGKCEKVCPQHLSIRRDLELAQKDLDSAAAAQE